jgi:hypothetical protein
LGKIESGQEGVSFGSAAVRFFNSQFELGSRRSIAGEVPAAEEAISAFKIAPEGM